MKSKTLKLENLLAPAGTITLSARDGCWTALTPEAIQTLINGGSVDIVQDTFTWIEKKPTTPQTREFTISDFHPIEVGKAAIAFALSPQFSQRLLDAEGRGVLLVRSEFVQLFNGKPLSMVFDADNNEWV